MTRDADGATPDSRRAPAELPRASMLFVRTIALFESTCLPSTSSALRSQIERGQPVASVTQRDQDFGVYYGQQRGFNQDVLLRIQLEGVKVN
jgi:hypothetical protein